MIGPMYRDITGTDASLMEALILNSVEKVQYIFDSKLIFMA